MAESFRVEIVSANRLVWEGDAIHVMATTAAGEIGILARHIPLIATLAKSGVAEVTAPDGVRHIAAFAVAGSGDTQESGFVSVRPGEDGIHVTVLSPYAQMLEDLDVDAARRELRRLSDLREGGDNTPMTEKAYQRARAQVKAADRKNGS
ncbi:MAG: hypothetical protein LBE83_08660 [Propionibacteriaceae bacterium]|jgi:F-type H+-transporting ATPase subunit epsilon|nr:hypothetical protein [Propionibacteriaceae bacterium]